jgi:RNA polymerase sigma factor (sigma-70 family)
VTPDRELVALVRAARAGDHDAWSGLVRRFDGPLRGIARSYRLAPADVDDVLQATWIRLLRHIGRIHEPAAIAGWLTTTVRRESMRLLQRPVREQLVDDPALGDRPEPDSAEAALLAAERRAVLDRALASLPERHRQLMMLLASEASPDYGRISEALDMPRGSIGPIRARCLARLERSVELRQLVGS